jgi:hypothetical protein
MLVIVGRDVGTRNAPIAVLLTRVLRLGFTQFNLPAHLEEVMTGSQLTPIMLDAPSICAIS